jgi:hypothetical protein
MAAVRADAAGAAALGNYDRAVTLYSQVVDEKASASLRLLYGSALLGARRYNDARAQFDQCEAFRWVGSRNLGVPAAIPWIDSIPKQYRPADLDQNAAFEKLRGRADFQELFRK